MVPVLHEPDSEHNIPHLPAGDSHFNDHLPTGVQTHANDHHYGSGCGIFILVGND